MKEVWTNGIKGEVKSRTTYMGRSYLFVLGTHKKIIYLYCID